MSLTALLVPAFRQMLNAVAAWLDKAIAHAESQGEPRDSVLSWRLAEDMYPLAAQVRFVCIQALEPTQLLRGQALPDRIEALRREGWGSSEQPGTMAEAKARIQETLSVLDGLDPQSLDDGETRQIALALPNGLAFEMTGSQYVRDWVLPQFYFHVVTAYGILRSRGVALGKADLVPHMLAYMARPAEPES